MASFYGNSEDRITGEVAPIGHITGFPKPYIRSAWPTPRGPVLTTHRINKYIKEGYYVTNNSVARAEKRSAKKQRTQIEDFI